MSNLTPEHTSFVGRDLVLVELERLLARRRLVSLIGGAGVGKTRTAKELARELESRADLDAVAFVDLSCALDVGDVERAVAAAFELPISKSGRSLAAMIESLGETALVLDDIDYLASAAGPLIAELAAECPQMRLVLTSREPIDIASFEVYRLEPLRPGEAIALFESRARMVQHDFAVHVANRASIEAIVELLGRLPLAIELAAARAGVMSLEALSDSIAQAALRGVDGAIEWSWQQLTPWERSTLAQCSLFRGGFDLAAVEQIVDLSDHPTAPRAIDVVQSLKTLGIVRSYSPAPFPNEVRFDLFENVRRLAWDMLAASGFTEHAARQHARRYLAVVRSWFGTHEMRARAELEIDNLLVAQRRTEVADPALSVQLGLTLDRLLPSRARYGLRRSVLDRAIAAAQAGVDPELLVEAMLARAHLERSDAATSS